MYKSLKLKVEKHSYGRTGKIAVKNLRFKNILTLTFAQ